MSLLYSAKIEKRGECMSNWQTFLQNFFPLAEEIREKRFAGKYRAAVLIFTALAFSVLDVTPAGFVGNERQAFYPQ